MQIAIDFENVLEHHTIDIKKLAPFLFKTQVEDIQKILDRFEIGKGYLITNGTGTGKTFVGLGTIKMFFQQNKRDVFIIVPTEKKCKDWIEEGKLFGLNIHQIENIHDPGKEISVTTYANFYQNQAILRRNRHLIVYDEAHYLNQNAQGYSTSYFEQHRELANLPSVVKRKVKNFHSVYYIDENGNEKLDKKKFKSTVQQIVSETKVLFLSATPFAYHKSIKYADGTLFEIDEEIDETDYDSSYNAANGWERFLVENFGYRMRYNKCTVPESGVDIDLMERNFFEKFNEQGIMSTRQINIDVDYSREFVTIDSDLGKRIDDGLELFHKEEFYKRYPEIHDRIGRKYNYNYITQLIECIKAREIHSRIQQHLDLGRKVVIFHNYNNSLISHPFQFTSEELQTKDEYYNVELEREISRFRNEYWHLWNLDLSSLRNSRDAIKKHFPDAKEFNGTINKKKRNEIIRLFNEDNSDINILIVQVKAGQEGISLHDKTGIHQRVLINLGLPTAPTQAIQTEGRIYREGTVSNAIYEYITLQTVTERLAFASLIATRSKTAENLAMGNLARDLETAFKEGYKNSSYFEPNLNQGFGGKEADKNFNEISEFQKAITYYYAKGKKTASNKAKEGIDYFATPEPLGFKMVEWLNPQPNEDMMEPSSGHGAIARFFPGNTTNHFIEPSHYLASELSINTKGTVHITAFENYYVGNKFNKIAMNPPFGTSGKTAMEHVEKACKHLHWSGGVLIAIVPNGPSMQKRLDLFFNSQDKYRLTGEIILPQCTFERAGTSVNCKIIRIQDGYHQGNYEDYNHIDLSYIKEQKTFFETLENLEF